MLRSMLRPRSATRRPWAAAASSTCCTRCTWLEKLATITRRGALPITWSSTGPIDALERREAGDVGVGRVDEEQVDALLAEPRERAQVGQAAVEGQLVHLEVAGGEHQARGRADRDGERVGDRVVDRDELEVERAEASRAGPP